MEIYQDDHYTMWEITNHIEFVSAVTKNKNKNKKEALHMKIIPHLSKWEREK